MESLSFQNCSRLCARSKHWRPRISLCRQKMPNGKSITFDNFAPRNCPRENFNRKIVRKNSNIYYEWIPKYLILLNPYFKIKLYTVRVTCRFATSVHLISQRPLLQSTILVWKLLKQCPKSVAFQWQIHQLFVYSVRANLVKKAWKIKICFFIRNDFIITWEWFSTLN